MKGTASCIRHEEDKKKIEIFPINFGYKFSIWVKNSFLSNSFFWQWKKKCSSSSTTFRWHCLQIRCSLFILLYICLFHFGFWTSNAIQCRIRFCFQTSSPLCLAYEPNPCWILQLRSLSFSTMSLCLDFPISETERNLLGYWSVVSL